MDQSALNANGKIVWTMWYQGLSETPDIVRKCMDSWRQKNRGWQVIALDKDTLQHYLPVDFISSEARKRAPLPALSDIIRILLLEKYGGVWVDATCFCSIPLDDWLPKAMPRGFFAYEGHRIDTPMSSWFLASDRSNPLVARLARATVKYWNENPRARVQGFPYAYIKRVINRSPSRTRLWFSFPVLRILRIRPYFWFHYLFTVLSERDPEVKAVWEQTPRVSAEPPHALQKIGLLSPAGDSALAVINSREIAVHKLSWKLHKVDAADASQLGTRRTVIDELFHQQLES